MDYDIVQSSDHNQPAPSCVNEFTNSETRKQLFKKCSSLIITTELKYCRNFIMKQDQQSYSPTRRGGVLFGSSTNYTLQTVKYAEAQRGILKVTSLEDSLLSCEPSLRTDPAAPKVKIISTTAPLRNSIRDMLFGIRLSASGMKRVDEEKLVQSSTRSHATATTEPSFKNAQRRSLAERSNRACCIWPRQAVVSTCHYQFTS